MKKRRGSEEIKASLQPPWIRFRSREGHQEDLPGLVTGLCITAVWLGLLLLEWGRGTHLALRS